MLLLVRSWKLLIRPIACLYLSLAANGCHAQFGSVTRVVDGVATEGRVITSEAYALYARGADFEVRGNLEQALVSYRAALDEDESAEIWTRVGALECRIAKAGGKEPESAMDAFEEALDIDSQYAPAFRELALCQTRFGSLESALGAALKAVEFDPNNVGTSLLVIELYEKLGRMHEAEVWSDALATRHPNDLQVQRARLAFAKRHQYLGRALRAHDAINALEILEPGLPRCLAPDHGEIDDALWRGDLPRARSLALGCKINAGELALRAAGLGLFELALKQATLVNAADPNDSSAWIAGLVASDLKRDDAQYQRWLLALGSAPTQASPLGARLLSGLIARRVGKDAAAEWLKKHPPQN